MKEEILKLVNALCQPTVDSAALDTLCEAACQRLDGMLADGVTPRDCAETYVTAAAWLVMDLLRDGADWDGVTSLSAGDMTVRREGASAAGRLEQRAMELMGPYLKDRSFVFQGVRG